MKHTLLLTLLIIASATLGFAQAANKPEQEMDKLTEAFRVAYLHRDTDALGALLTDDFLIVNSPTSKGMDKTQFLAGLKTPMRGPTKWESYEYSEIVRHYYGDAVMTFMVATLKGVNINGEPFTTRTRLTATAVKQQGRWLVAGIFVVIIPVDRVAARVDPKVFEAYVGQYGVADLVITILSEADKLIWQGPSGTKTELIPASETLFYLRGSQTQVAFVKDGAGKVIQLKQIASDGQEIKFKKIK